MGVVHRATSRDGRELAVKVLHSVGAETVARFEREQRLLAALGEPEGFVPLVDRGAGPPPFIVMPFLAGGSLRARLDRGPWSVDETVALGRALSRALGHAHGRGIVHRDLKPENVLFTAAGAPLVADLGLAKHFRLDVSGASQSAVLSKQGEVRGTWGYMPPEQMSNAKEVGPPADVFALGAILYECLAGAAPFEGASVMAVATRVAEGDFARLETVRPDVPPWLASIVHRALAAEPRARFADGTALASALELGSAPRRARRVSLVALALAAVVLGSLAWSRSRAPEEPPPAPAPPKVDEPRTPEPPRRSGPPAWWTALPPTKRPSWPLPSGVVATERAGQYENTKDGSVLVWMPAKGGMLSLFVGKYEVSIEQYAAFTRATGYKTFAEEEGRSKVLENRYSPLEEWPGVSGACFRFPDGPDKPSDPRWPAVHITGRDARAYCAWAGLRLPTDEEWLAAATPATGARYPWGNEMRPELANLDGDADGYPRLAPVDAFPGGESPVGARNMCGNAWELVEASASELAVLDTARGGAWTSDAKFEANLTEPDNRWQIGPTSSCNVVGFRVARDGR
jgi:serine/threonine protein kinase